MNQGVLPRIGIVTRGEAGIDDMEQERADDFEREEQDANTDAVRPARTGTLHGEHDLPQLRQCHLGDPKTTRTNSRQAARDVGRHPGASEASRDTRADIYKKLIHLIRSGRGEGD